LMAHLCFAANIGLGLSARNTRLSRTALRPRRSTVNSNINSAKMSLSVKDIDGKEVDLGGKVVFVMNVASACGYTASGYDLLRDLTAKYTADKFSAVAIPCNAFGSQESGSDGEIKAFASTRAGSALVIAEKSNVNGSDAHPLVRKAKEIFPDKIAWNFDGRYVFDSSGKPVARFSNSSSDGEIMAEIDKHL